MSANISQLIHILRYKLLIYLFITYQSPNRCCASHELSLALSISLPILLSCCSLSWKFRGSQGRQQSPRILLVLLSPLAGKLREGQQFPRILLILLSPLVGEPRVDNNFPGSCLFCCLGWPANHGQTTISSDLAYFVVPTGRRTPGRQQFPPILLILLSPLPGEPRVDNNFPGSCLFCCPRAPETPRPTNGGQQFPRILLILLSPRARNAATDQRWTTISSNLAYFVVPSGKKPPTRARNAATDQRWTTISSDLAYFVVPSGKKATHVGRKSRDRPGKKPTRPGKAHTRRKSPRGPAGRAAERPWPQQFPRFPPQTCMPWVTVL